MAQAADPQSDAAKDTSSRIPWVLSALKLPERAWERPIARGIVKLAKRPPEDRWALWRSSTAIEADQVELVALAQQTEPLRMGGLQGTYELISALNDIGDAPSPPPLSLLLAHLALELHLRDSTTSAVSELCSISRGLMGPSRTPEFRLTFSGIASLRALAEQMCACKQKGESIGHAGFSKLWTGTLQTLVADLLASGSVIRSLMAPRSAGSLPFDPDAESLDVGSSVSDEPVPLKVSLIPEVAQGHEAPRPYATLAVAKALAIMRRGRAGLMLEPECILPAALASRTLEAAERSFERGLASRDLAAATEALCAMLLVVVGATEHELMSATFGQTCDANSVIDLNAGLFLRPETRPPNACTPGNLDSGAWQSTGGAIPMVLPEKILQAARMLHDARTNRSSLLIPRLSASGPVVPDLSLYRILRAFVPQHHLIPGLFRLRIGATISQALGPEAAQVAFGDSFGLSSSGTYYSRWLVSDLAKAAWTAVAPLVGLDPKVMPEHVRLPTHYVGSRVAPEDELIKEWTATHRKVLHRLSQLAGRNLQETWRSKALGLSRTLLAGTGHRPNQALLELTLYDFIPDYSIAIFRDKRTDVAHLTRVAGVSPRLLAELRAYLDFLVGCQQCGDEKSAALAKKILQGDAPLLALPGSPAPERLEIKAVLADMPKELEKVQNVLRHRINQQLCAVRLDPEVRHQQLGWVLSPATATSDCSPRSVKDFGDEIAPSLDGCLVEDGWVSKFPTPRKWDWEAVPLPPLRDWASELLEHERDHATARRELRQALVESKAKLVAAHGAELHAAIAAIFPKLSIARTGKQFVLTLEAGSDPVSVSPDTAAAVLQLAHRPDHSAAVTHVLRSELVRLLRNGATRKVTTGFIPSCLRISESSIASPFLAGTGLAVRQAEELRRAILSTRGRDLGVRALLSILSWSPYRSFSIAQKILAGAPHTFRQAEETGVLRIPLGGKKSTAHVALTGRAVGALLAWTSSKAAAQCPSEEQVANWLKKHVPELVVGLEDPTQTVNCLERTLQIAGRVELSGPERLIMLREVEVTCVSPERVIGWTDSWVASRSGDAQQRDDGEPPGTSDESDVSMPKRTRKPSCAEWEWISQLIASFESEKTRILPLTGEIVGQARHGNRSKILAEIAARQNKWKGRWTAPQCVLAYLQHLATRGGRNKKHLRSSTIATQAWRFSWPFVEICGQRELAELPSEELETIFLSVLLTRPSRWRPRVLESLRHFHWAISDQCALPDVEWTQLKQVAGMCVDGVDAGMFWITEIKAVLAALMSEAEEARAKPGTDPREILLREQRLIGVLLLEASGVRPASVRGLTFGDIVFSDVGDYVQIRASGAYASAKTANSVGFFHLDGSLWRAWRPHVRAWFEAQSQALGDAFAELPVFHQLDHPRERHSREEIFGRTGRLFRWASDEPAARNYWLRKNRIARRHRQMHEQSTPPRARDAYRVLSQSGHAHIVTPLRCYLHDPAIAVARHCMTDVKVSRADALAITGWKPVTLDQRIQRHRAAKGGAVNSAERVAAVIRALGPAVTAQSRMRAPRPPPEEKQLGCVRLWDIDRWLREFQGSGSAVTCSARTGVNGKTSEKLATLLEDFEQRSLISPRRRENCRYMGAPRCFEGHRALSVNETTQPDPDLTTLAKAWVEGAALVPMSAGLQVPTSASRERALEWLGGHGIQHSEDVVRRGRVTIPTLVPLRSTAVSDTPEKRVQTAWPQLRWLLLLHWLAFHLNDAKAE